MESARRPGVVLLLIGLAAVPLVGLGWFATSLASSASETRSEVTELERAADDLLLAVRADGDQHYESYWRAAEALMGTEELSDVVAVIAPSVDLPDFVEDRRAGTATTVPAAQLATALAPIGLGGLIDVQLDQLVRLAARLDDGDRLVTAARALGHALEMRSAMSSRVAAYFYFQVDGGQELTGLTDQAARDHLVIGRARYEAARAAIDRLTATNSALARGLDGVLGADANTNLERRLSETVDSGPPARIDLTQLGDLPLAAMLDLARVFSDSFASAELHIDLIDVAVRELTGQLDEIRADATARAASVLVTSVAIAAVTVLTAVVVARAIARPLRRVSDAAEALRSGDPMSEVPVRGPREVRSVATALNEALSRMTVAERQAIALADGRLDDPAFGQAAPGQLGRSLSAAVGRLKSSLEEREEYRRRLAHEAAHDGLTSLPNRTASITHLGNALARRERAGGLLAVLFVDLDGFKQVNDIHGHQAGDLVLQTTARRLVGACRDGDLVGRLGGDEFLVVAEPIIDGAEAVALAHRLRDALTAPISVGVIDVTIDASVGIAVADGHLTADELIRDADLAVYQAKSLGRGRAQICDDTLRDRLIREADISDSLRAAIDGDELELHFQAIVDATSGAVSSIEALIRWPRPEGMVMPDEFVPLAERSDLIVEMGRWVIGAAARQLAQWSSHPVLGDVPVAVNVSARHLTRGTLDRDIIDALDLVGVDPRRMIVEITENALLEDVQEAAACLRELRAHGVHIAVDDFGTGYTSLTHLRSLPVDILKIDRTFVANLDNDDERSLVKLIVDTGHLLGVDVTAEGVETEDQARILRTLGSDKLQGYRYSQPVSAEVLESSLTGGPIGTFTPAASDA